MTETLAEGHQHGLPVTLQVNGILEALAEPLSREIETGCAEILHPVASYHAPRLAPVQVEKSRDLHAIRPLGRPDPRSRSQFWHHPDCAALVDVVHEVMPEHAAGVEVQAVLGEIRQQPRRFQA